MSLGPSPVSPPTLDGLGAAVDGTATEFRVFAGQASAVTLCLFDAPDAKAASRRVSLEPSGTTPGVWTRRVEGVGAGALYGYRVNGPWNPAEGHFHHPSKLLIDPWALAVSGEPRPDAALFAFGSDGARLAGDSAGAMPKAVVVEPPAPVSDAERPQIPWSDTVIYEAHVEGLTRRHPDVAPAHQGRYLGLCSEPMLDHFRRLGVTSVELLPIHQAAPEAHLIAQGKRNYWGYAPVSFFAPTAAYASGSRGEQVAEFRTMVDRLHAAGLEVLLDVVFNHTAEGGADGTVYGPKGFDARGYYRWRDGRFEDFTGTGNTLDIRSPVVFHMVLASLRYAVGVLGVDGFRFDLAPTVGRDPEAFRGTARLFKAIAADPLLAPRKWIAEPWDLGPDGYQLGAFPAPFREWNDKFRDTVRRFWRGEASGPLCAELATRFAGSQDVFPERSPTAGVNYVTAHDGFTLTDLVSYHRKRNHANGEDNRDGRDENLSRNWGVEGPTDDPEVLARRARARRSLMATLLLAQGVPMIAHGDELGRTQGGNNNVYCQDNDIAWVDWHALDPTLFDFMAQVLELRRRCSQLRRERFLTTDDVRWIGADGRRLGSDDWRRPELRAFAAHLEGDAGPEILVVWNGGDSAVPWRLPAGRWICTVDGAAAQGSADAGRRSVPAFSVVVFEKVAASAGNDGEPGKDFDA
ncbi:MAG: glycogen debranching protein GlgX [Acidobacteriota bacterium]